MRTESIVLLVVENGVLEPDDPVPFAPDRPVIAEDVATTARELLGSGDGGSGLSGAFVGGVAFGWLPGIAGGGGCACTNDGASTTSAVRRDVKKKVRKLVVIG